MNSRLNELTHRQSGIFLSLMEIEQCPLQRVSGIVLKLQIHRISRFNSTFNRALQAEVEHLVTRFYSNR